MWEDDEQTEAEASVVLQIRESIKALFPHRTCFPLVRPMSDESQLQRLEAVPSSQLRPEFKQVGPSVLGERELLTGAIVLMCRATVLPQCLVHRPDLIDLGLNAPLNINGATSDLQCHA